MSANYNNSAWFYDPVSRLVYGDSLIRSQSAFLNLIPAGSNILIAGGGTGLILEKIAALHPGGLQIWYVEVSEKMIEKARRRNAGQNRVNFIVAAVESLDLADNIDVIITPFLLDNFNDTELAGIFAHLHKTLKSDGLWLNTDFQLTGKWWQKLLLKSMFVFFHLLGCVAVNKLPAIAPLFKRAGYRLLDEKTFYGDFIVSSAYVKT